MNTNTEKERLSPDELAKLNNFVKDHMNNLDLLLKVAREYEEKVASITIVSDNFIKNL